MKEEQLSMTEGEGTSVGDTTEQTELEVESLRSLLSERCKELEEAVQQGERRAEELAHAQEGIKVCTQECVQCSVNASPLSHSPNIKAKM